MNTPVKIAPRLALWGELGSSLLLLMELTWASCLYYLLVKPDTTWSSIAPFLIVVSLGSYLLARATEWLKLSYWAGAIVLILWVVISLGSSVKLILLPDVSTSISKLGATLVAELLKENGFRIVIHLVFIQLAALRGAVVAKRSIGVSELTGSLKIGLGAFLVLALVASAKLGGFGITAFFIFLGLALTGTTLARVASLGEEGRRLPQFTGKRMAIILACSLSLAVLSFTGGWLVHGTMASLAAQVVMLAAFATLVVMGILLSPLLYGITALTRWLAEKATGAVPIRDPEVTIQQALQDLGVQADPNGDLLSKALYNARPIMAVIAVLLVAVLLLVVLRRQRRRRALAEEENMIHLIAGRRKSGSGDGRDRRGRWLGNTARILAAARIRRIYAQLEVLCARLDAPRHAAQTPLEYLPRQQSLFVNLGEELETITSAYLKVRYGELPENQDQVVLVLEAWQTVQTAGKKLLAEKRLKSPVKTKTPPVDYY